MRANDGKVLFVLVEGISDAISLRGSFEAAFPEKKVLIEAFQGDITTDRSSNEGNIGELVYEAMYLRLRQLCLDDGDVSEIIHIVDTDGAYLDDKRVIQEDSRREPYYDASKCAIRTRDKFGIQCRNEQKRSNIDRLVDCADLFGIPYRVFYMSCNLDHVLNGNPNTPGSQKAKGSKRFALRFRDDLPGFVRFISGASQEPAAGYPESWDRLRFDDGGSNSIRKGTNLNIAFDHIG